MRCNVRSSCSVWSVFAGVSGVVSLCFQEKCSAINRADSDAPLKKYKLHVRGDQHRSVLFFAEEQNM